MSARQIFNEETLISFLREKNPLGMRILVDNYSASLKSIIYSIVKNTEHSEDILQEVFIKVWKKFDQYNSEKGALFTWLAVIARNESISFLRSQKIQISDGPAVPDENIPENFSVDLELLPEVEKNILKLHYFEGYTQKEISSILSIPEGTVKTKTRYAYNRLRKFMS